MTERRARGIGRWALLVLVSLSLGACATAERRPSGSDLLGQGRYEEAISAFERELAESPHDANAANGLQRARAELARKKYDEARRLKNAGQLERALELALEAEALYGTRQPLVEQLNAQVAKGREDLDRANAAIDAGQPQAAVELLEVAAEASGLSAYEGTLRRARLALAAALRSEAAERTREGDLEDARAKLAEASRLETLAGGAPLTSAPPAAPGAPEGTPAAAGTAPPTASLSSYVEAGTTIQAMVEGLPRRRGRGLAEPEDYAIPEDQIPRLAEAIATAIATKPKEEGKPHWLGRGQLVLQMSVEVAALKRIAEARVAIETGRIGEGLARAESVRALGPAVLEDLEIQTAYRAVRKQAGARLLRAAQTAAAAKHLHLAGLRARQAAEIDPSLQPEADKLTSQKREETAGPSLVLLPLQDFTQAGDIAPRLAAALETRLTGKPTLTYREYAERTRAGQPVTAAGLLRGDVVRLDAQVARDAQAAQSGRIQELSERLRLARRRVIEATDRDARLLAMTEVDELERELARARRARGDQVFAEPSPPSTPQVVITLEVRFGLTDPRTSASLAIDGFHRTLVGPEDERERIVARLVDEAADRMAEVAGRVLASATRPTDPRTIADPGRRLDAQIAYLERTGASGAPDLVRAVLEATGYSFASGRTVIEQLRLDE